MCNYLARAVANVPDSVMFPRFEEKRMISRGAKHLKRERMKRRQKQKKQRRRSRNLKILCSKRMTMQWILGLVMY